MTTLRASSAPHLYLASRWDGDLVLFQRAAPAVTMGVRRHLGGRHTVALDRDELCYIVGGRATFRRDSGTAVDVEPGTVVHLKEGWRGVIDVREPLDLSYARAPGAPGADMPVVRGASTAGPLEDRGPVSSMIDGGGQSVTARLLLSQVSDRRDAERRAETGIWTCTPGTWRCRVSRDEFCHFIDGHSLYTHESGEEIAIAPDTLAVFPAGWTGVCEVEQTVRKVYMIV
jgi:uncharacterized protein